MIASPIYTHVDTLMAEVMATHPQLLREQLSQHQQVQERQASLCELASETLNQIWVSQMSFSKFF